MRYRLPDDLSFCRVDDRLVFLDVLHDRYFLLPASQEQAFVAWLDHPESAGTDIALLLANKVLTEASPSPGTMQTEPVCKPERSVAERFPARGAAQPAALLEVLSIVVLTRWQLKHRTLKQVLGSMTRNRRASPAPQLRDCDGVSDTISFDAAGVFAQARRYVPVEPTCLLDSIALARFLSRRHQPGSLVFGVTGAPFSAHCWIQVGTTVLNDTVGNVGAYTPIREVRWPAGTLR